MSKNAWFRTTAPFIYESLYQLLLDSSILLALGYILSVMLESPGEQKNLKLILLYLALITYTFSFLFVYRLGLMALIDSLKKDYVTKVLVIKEIRTELAYTAGNFTSIVAKFYKKEMDVDRYKLICFDSDSRNYIIRIVLPGKTYSEFSDIYIWKNESIAVNISYFRRSRIFYRMDLSDRKQLKAMSKREQERLILLINKLNKG